MFEMFTNAGPFAYVVTLLGATALTLNIVQLSRRKGRDLTGLILGLTAATVLMGLSGTGAGMYMAGQTINGADPAAIPRLFAFATGIALTTTTFGALWAALNTVLCGVARTVRAG